MNQLNWQAIGARDFRSRPISEGKQAEFLVHEAFPFDLVERIGVMTRSVADQVAELIEWTTYEPHVTVRRNWYY